MHRESTDILQTNKVLSEDEEDDELDRTDAAIDEALRCGKSDYVRVSRNSNDFGSAFDKSFPSDPRTSLQDQTDFFLLSPKDNLIKQPKSVQISLAYPD